MFPDYEQMGVGLARIMDERPVADVRTAQLILGWWLDPEGYLRNDFRVMPFIADEWNEGSQPTAFGGLLGMVFHRMEGGERPEILFFTTSGVFRFAPWTRGAGAAGNRGLAEQLYWRHRDTAGRSITPQGRMQFRPQAVGMGNAVFFTFTDGGNIWVWTGDDLRPFGYQVAPPPPSAQGPTRQSSTEPNSGGFSHRGRVGDLNGDWTTEISNDQEVVGGIEPLRRAYWVVYENEAGGYSPISPEGGSVTLRQQLGDPGGGNPLERLRRLFWVRDINVGPPGTRARIVLASRNLELAVNVDDTLPRFLHRIPNNVAVEYVDNIPDGELGPIWNDREPAPSAMILLPFSGSLLMMRTQAHPARVWWTEQTGLNAGVLESCLKGHWRDISPETGAITGAIGVRLPHDNAAAAALILKERGVHYITGSYPNWRDGTLHTKAGLEGPDLIQSSPDGSVLWYGARTFWRMDPNSGKIDDVGAPVRKRLRRVNKLTARYGQSWVDEVQNEVVFVLPLDDKELPDLQFAWDYINMGWRLRNDVEVRAAMTLPGTEYVVLAGVWNSIDTLWVYHKGHPGYSFTAPTAQYKTAWFPQTNPEDLHDQANTRSLIFLMQETHQGQANVLGYKDWNGDVPEFGITDTGLEDETIFLHNPEEGDSTAFYAPSPSDADPDSSTAQYDDESYVWRRRRTFSHQLSAMISSAEVVQIELKSSNHMAFYALDSYGPHMRRGGGNSPRND